MVPVSSEQRSVLPPCRFGHALIDVAPSLHPDLCVSRAVNESLISSIPAASSSEVPKQATSWYFQVEPRPPIALHPTFCAAFAAGGCHSSQQFQSPNRTIDRARPRHTREGWWLLAAKSCHLHYWIGGLPRGHPTNNPCVSAPLRGTTGRFAGPCERERD